MLRKMLLSTVAALALLSPLTLTSPVQAHEHRYHECEYRVYYRVSCHRPWSCAGTFHYWCNAERCADHYRCRGYEVRVR